MGSDMITPPVVLIFALVLVSGCSASRKSPRPIPIAEPKARAETASASQAAGGGLPAKPHAAMPDT